MATGLFTLKQQVLAIREGGWPGQKPLAVDYLVVAGGGAGAVNRGAGGGGGGGLLQGNIGITPGSSITVTVGAGGTGASSGAVTNGSNSVFGSITSTGGGRGGSNQDPASAPFTGFSGGSGGGGGSSTGSGGFGGQGTSGQGNTGGSATGNATTSNEEAGGGGGGAGTVGLSTTTAKIGANGGAGVASDISGTRTAYAGGGGGSGSGSGATGGAGGAGGGGAGRGSSDGNGNATAGTANTGGGGGAHPSQAITGSSGNGGSGIVIVSYPDIYAAAASTTGSPTVSTSGSGSIFFGGSSQYLTYSANSFSTSGNWTIEAWCYFTSSGNTDVVVNGLASDRLYLIFVGTTFFVGDGTTNNINISNAKLLNQWFHLAVVKNGSTYTAYINGSSIGSSTTALTSTTLTTWQVGGRSSTSVYTQGYLSNVRIVTSAVYTGNFTVPTTPLAAISNTQLLLSSVSGAYLTDSSTNANAPTMVNTVTWNALSPFATGLGYKNRVYTWTSSGSITF